MNKIKNPNEEFIPIWDYIKKLMNKIYCIPRVTPKDIFIQNFLKEIITNFSEYLLAQRENNSLDILQDLIKETKSDIKYDIKNKSFSLITDHHTTEYIKLFISKELASEIIQNLIENKSHSAKSNIFNLHAKKYHINDY